MTHLVNAWSKTDAKARQHEAIPSIHSRSRFVVSTRIEVGLECSIHYHIHLRSAPKTVLVHWDRFGPTKCLDRVNRRWILDDEHKLREKSRLARGRRSPPALLCLQVRMRDGDDDADVDEWHEWGCVDPVHTQTEMTQGIHQYLSSLVSWGSLVDPCCCRFFSFGLPFVEVGRVLLRDEQSRFLAARERGFGDFVVSSGCVVEVVGTQRCLVRVRSCVRSR